MIEVFNHSHRTFSFVTELKKIIKKKKGCFLAGAGKGSQEPFLLRGKYPSVQLLFEECMNQQLELTKMLLELKNLTLFFLI